MDTAGFNFVRFTDTGKSFNARATIRTNGQIGFNEGARNLFCLSNYNHVVLFYDQGQRAIGFMFTASQEEQGALPFKVDTRNTCVNAAGFLDKNGIDYKSSSRYSLEQHGNLIVMVLDSKELENDNEKNRDEVLEDPVTESRI